MRLGIKENSSEFGVCPLLLLLLIIGSVLPTALSDNDGVPTAPERPTQFSSAVDVKNYLSTLRHYYSVVSRPRFGKRSYPDLYENGGKKIKVEHSGRIGTDETETIGVTHPRISHMESIKKIRAVQHPSRRIWSDVLMKMRGVKTPQFGFFGSSEVNKDVAHPIEYRLVEDKFIQPSVVNHPFFKPRDLGREFEETEDRRFVEHPRQSSSSFYLSDLAKQFVNDPLGKSSVLFRQKPMPSSNAYQKVRIAAALRNLDDWLDTQRPYYNYE